MLITQLDSHNLWIYLMWHARICPVPAIQIFHTTTAKPRQIGIKNFIQTMLRNSSNDRRYATWRPWMPNEKHGIPDSHRNVTFRNDVQYSLSVIKNITNSGA
jgi:hypothetical protein